MGRPSTVWNDMDLSDARPRLPALTSLRFFAAFHVVIFHFQAMQIFIGPAWFQKLSSIGYVGVSFFFVLSGFILVYTYAGTPVSRRVFWHARFARVYPAYAFALLLARFGRLSRKQLFAVMAACLLASNFISGAYTVLRPDGIHNPDSNVYTS